MSEPDPILTEGPAARLRRIVHEELVLLLVPLGLLVAVGLFFGLAEAVEAGATRELDARVLRSLRGDGDPGQVLGSPTLTKVARDLTALGSSPVLALVCVTVAGYLALRARWIGLAVVALAAAGGGIITEGLKALYARARPDVVPHLDHVGETFSFPSGHTLASAVIYLTLAAMLARLTPRWPVKVYLLGVAGGLCLLIGSSRVALGVHYPSDVVAGWSAALAWASTCWLVVRLLQAKGVVPPPSVDWERPEGEEA